MASEIIVEFPSPLTDKEKKMIYGYKSEVVRCKDCKHMISHNEKDWCRMHWMKTQKERYCSEGKRKHGNDAERAHTREQKEAGAYKHNS